MFIKYFLDYSIKLEYKSSIKALDPVWVDSLATTRQYPVLKCRQDFGPCWLHPQGK